MERIIQWTIDFQNRKVLDLSKKCTRWTRQFIPLNAYDKKMQIHRLKLIEETNFKIKSLNSLNYYRFLSKHLIFMMHYYQRRSHWFGKLSRVEQLGKDPSFLARLRDVESLHNQKAQVVFQNLQNVQSKIKGQKVTPTRVNKIIADSLIRQIEIWDQINHNIFDYQKFHVWPVLDYEIEKYLNTIAPSIIEMGIRHSGIKFFHYGRSLRASEKVDETLLQYKVDALGHTMTKYQKSPSDFEKTGHGVLDFIELVKKECMNKPKIQRAPIPNIDLSTLGKVA